MSKKWHSPTNASLSPKAWAVLTNLANRCNGLPPYQIVDVASLRQGQGGLSDNDLQCAMKELRAIGYVKTATRFELKSPHPAVRRQSNNDPFNISDYSRRSNTIPVSVIDYTHTKVQLTEAGYVAAGGSR